MPDPDKTLYEAPNSRFQLLEDDHYQEEFPVVLSEFLVTRSPINVSRVTTTQCLGTKNYLRKDVISNKQRGQWESLGE